MICKVRPFLKLKSVIRNGMRNKYGILFRIFMIPKLLNEKSPLGAERRMNYVHNVKCIYESLFITHFRYLFHSVF